MIRCIKRRTWLIIMVLVIAIFLIAAVLTNESEPEQREFGGTFIKGYFYEHLYQAQEKNQFI